MIFDHSIKVDIVIIVCFLLYMRFKVKWCRNFTCLVGKTVIVTGANKGIGYECALDFAKRGARVILACRNQDLGNEAKNKIIKLSQNSNVVVKYVDFKNLKTVRDFAKDILETEERLDILVNNIGASEISEIVDGLPIMLLINYYAHVLLTILLLDILKRSAPSRIINVSSILAVIGNLDAKNLNKPVTMFKNKWAKVAIEYGNAKFGQISFTQRLGELLKDQNIYVFSVHPGIVKTDIMDIFSGIVKFLWKFIFLEFFSRTPEEGAQTLIYTATEPGLEKYTGRHFENCGLYFIYPNCRDSTKRNEIFSQTLKNLGLDEQLRRIEHLENN